MSSIRRIPALAAVAFAMSGGFDCRAGQPYEFVRIVKSVAPFGAFAPPAMNQWGEVAFMATLSNGQCGIYTSRGGALTAIVEAPFDGFILVSEILDINGDGSVVFTGNKFNGIGLYLGDGGPLQTLVEPGSEWKPGPPQINDAGTVVFRGENAAQSLDAIFRCDGPGRPPMIVADSSGFLREFHAAWPCINQAGDIVFRASQDDETRGIFKVPADGGPRDVVTMVDSSGPLSTFEFDPVINENGVVTWSGFVDSGGKSLLKIDGAGITTLASTPNGLGLPFVGPVTNNSGTTALLRTMPDGQTILLDGPDPVADRVIGPGDPLDGGTVLNLSWINRGLNDAGELAFSARILTNSGGGFSIFNGVYRAVPSVACRADLDQSGAVDIDDLLAVLAVWGPCVAAGCGVDIVPPGGNGVVDIDDLLGVINSWGNCR